MVALTGTQTTDAALSGDRGALHDRSGAGLANARQRADDLGDLRLSGQVIIAAQDIGEREGACCQAGQQVRPLGARLASLLQRCLALLGRRAGSAMRASFKEPRSNGGILDGLPVMAGNGGCAAAGPQPGLLPR